MQPVRSILRKELPRSVYCVWRKSYRASFPAARLLSFEWRDNRRPYRVGPSLLIDAAGHLTVHGDHLLDLPRDTWITLRMTCALGKAATGRVDLKITVKGQPTRRFEELPCGDPTFNQLEWLGTTSLAKAKCVFHIDNIKLDGKP